MPDFLKTIFSINQAITFLILISITLTQTTLAEEIHLDDKTDVINSNPENDENISIQFKSNPSKQRIVVVGLEGAISKNLLKKSLMLLSK